MKKKIKKSKKEDNKILKSILLRYFILLIVAFPGFWIFYKIFTPLTVYLVYFTLSLFYNVSLVSNTILIINNQLPIQLIPACIAGAAYYLLLVLNLSTPEIKLNKRIKAIIFSFSVFLILNVLRIVLLANLAFSGSPYFDVTHTLFWYGVSTIFVVGIWFSEVILFKIKKIPCYSDLKWLYEKSHLKN